jgi:hypothetical protein
MQYFETPKNISVTHNLKEEKSIRCRDKLIGHSIKYLNQGKGKVVPMNKSASRREDIRGSGGTAPPFLTSALHGGELSSANGLSITL